MERVIAWVLLLPLVCFEPAARAAVDIELVPIGNPGNAPDERFVSGVFGSVGYNYQIGKYEVTAGQYTEFLNAVAQDDPYGLYNLEMADTGTGQGVFGANIQRTGAPGNYAYTVPSDWANRPVNYVSFWDAARFANWLHNGQPTGPQGPETTEGGAYINVGNQATFGRQPGARFFIPTEDEWYKAAYHDASASQIASYFGYPTGAGLFSLPGRDLTEATNPGNNANYGGNFNFVIGSPYYRTEVGEFELSDSSYGTFDQAGNVAEWNETRVSSLTRGYRGGSFAGIPGYMLAYARDSTLPTIELGFVGFRVAGIPEPGTFALAEIVLLAMLGCARRGVVVRRDESHKRIL